MRLMSLLLCVAFVGFLFKRDLKKKNKVSLALWVPLIWMIILYSRSVSAWLNLGYSVDLESSTAVDEGNSLDRNIFFIFIIIGLFILSRRKNDWHRIIQNNGWLIWLYYYCILSVMWSDLPFVSFKRLIRDLGNIVMVLVVMTESDPIEAIKTMIRRCMYVLVPLSIVFIKFFPEYGRYWSPFGGQPLYVGVAAGKNGLGVLCLIAGFFFIWELLILWRNRKISLDKNTILIDALFLFMIAYLFHMANSQTSFGTLIIGVSILISLSLIRKKINFVGFFFFHIALIVIVAVSTDLLRIIIEDYMERDMTFTGRTDFWIHLLETDINPLIGTGYRSFWAGTRLDKLWTDYWWHPKQAHNGYVETYLNLGIIGILSLIAIIISTYRNHVNELLINFEMGKFRMAILFMVLIYNYTEASFIMSTPLWFLFLITAIKIPQQNENIKQIGLSNLKT